MRLKNLQLGYTLPKSLLKNLGVSSLRVYYSGENLFTLDNMRGNIDPEATSQRLSSYPPAAYALFRAERILLM